MYIGTYTPNTVTRHTTQPHGTTTHGPSTGTWDSVGDSTDGITNHGTGHTTRGIGVILVNGTHSVGGSIIITTTDSVDTGTAGSNPHTAATATHHTQAATAADSAAVTYPALQVRQEPIVEYAPPHPAPTATA